MRVAVSVTRYLRPLTFTRQFPGRVLSTRAFTQSFKPRTDQELDIDKMGKKDESKGGFQLKVPKGTKDWDGKDMVIREKIFSTIANVFKRHGAVTIDT